MNPQRPDPAELLARVQREEGRLDSSGTARGRLKIFFGMAPGVGKTYAMLAAAQRMAGQGVDVVVGVVETHGRAETERLLLGLDILPRRQVEYRGPEGTAPPVTLHEFDLDAARARRPDIILVDELAHTNAPGSAHAKRWEDVQDLLRAGIGVYTTLNVQHIETLVDIVGQITGVAVRETVPDSVIDEADEIELVDVPVEVLYERLKAGKVYLAENAARAVDPTDGFFRKGNLTALRELALRRTAAWVDSELREYKRDRGIKALWPTGERVMVAVSPSPMSPKLVRAAKRMAAGLHAELLAVYVETPRSAELRPADAERLASTLRLAESLGATTTTLASDNAARELIAFARSRDVSRIVVGKTLQPRWREALFGNFVNNLIRESGEIDVYVVRGDDAGPLSAVPRPTGATAAAAMTDGSRLRRVLLSLLAVAVVTGIGSLVFTGLELANIAMVYLATVILVAIRLGRSAAVVAAVAGVAAFDFFFVTPRLTFAVSDVQYLVTFVTMLATGLIVGTLAARSREQAQTASQRAQRTSALYTLSRGLAAVRDAREVAAVATRQLHDLLGCDALLARPVARVVAADVAGRGLDVLAVAGDPDWFDTREQSVAMWSFEHGKSAGAGTATLPSACARYVPLTGPGGRYAVLGLRSRGTGMPMPIHDASMLDACAAQIASALERIELAESRHTAQLEAERERLRSALLSSVSHDLRTPLASITGAASVLEADDGQLGSSVRAELLRTISTEATRLNDLIANLVFATRLEAGSIQLLKEWTSVEEMVGAGLSRHREALTLRPFRAVIPEQLPMIRGDGAMLAQVVHNLIENALQYTAPGTPITLTAWATDINIVVRIADEGPGLADDERSKVFQRFYRGRSGGTGVAHHAHSGMGLGLTICEGIVTAHGGRIWAEQNTPHGAAFLFSLPIETPQPRLPEPEAVAATVEPGSRP